MKQIFLSLFLTNFIVTTFAQELPEVPLKNGLSYYKFDHKLENTNNKCVSSYFTNQTFYQKYMLYAHQLLTQDKSYDKKGIDFSIGNLAEYKLNCTDTIDIPNVGFKLSGAIANWTPTVIQLRKKKITGYQVMANIHVVFTSKNEYSLYIKNVNCTLIWAQGFNIGMDIFDLGELYTQVKNSASISKKDIEFFEELNFFIQVTDEIILKSLTETINLDQL